MYQLNSEISKEIARPESCPVLPLVMALLKAMHSKDPETTHTSKAISVNAFVAGSCSTWAQMQPLRGWTQSFQRKDPSLLGKLL